MSGWICWHRRLRAHWLWPENRPFTELEAWMDMVMRAAITERQVEVAGTLIALRRGELVASQGTLQGAWSWTRQAVRTFIRKLERDGMIRCEKFAGNNQRITILNYKKFQDLRPPDPDELTKHQPSSNQALTKHQPILDNKDLTSKTISTSKTKKTHIPPERDPSPVVDGCEFFRMNEKERELAVEYYKANKFAPELLRFAITEVESWLNTSNLKAVKARESGTHYRYLYAAWVLEKANTAFQVATRSGQPVNLRTFVPAPSRAQQTQDRIHRLRLESRATQQAIDVTPQPAKKALPE